MARGRGQQVKAAGEREAGSEAKVCPLCIEPLDPDEQQFYPCPCGYQVCVFCYDKLKLFCNNLCPGCRTEYGSQKDPYDPTVRHSTSSPDNPPPKVTVQPQADHLLPHQRNVAKGEQAVPGWLPMWGQHTEDTPSNSMLAASAADTATAWPSLAASQRQTQTQQTPSSLQQSPSLHQQSNQQQRQQQPDPSQEDAVSRQAGKRIMVPLPSPLDANQEPSVQADAEGAALLRTVQSAVGNGHLTIEDGTKQLVAFLRQREQAQGKPGSKASKPPPGFAVAANHPSLNPASSEPSAPVASDAASLSQPSHGPAESAQSTSTPSSNPLQATAHSFQQWALGMASAQLPSSSALLTGHTASSSAMPRSSTVFVFPVDMVAASASLWLAPATSGSGQLVSLRLHNNKGLPVLRKRQGPLYARTGSDSTHAEQGASTSAQADSKLPQQSHWLGLGNGVSNSQAATQSQSRNGYSNGYPHPAGQREHANGLPGNGSSSANSFSHAT